MIHAFIAWVIYAGITGKTPTTLWSVMLGGAYIIGLYALVGTLVTL